MFLYTLPLFSSFLFVYLWIPLTNRLAQRYQFVDHPTARKQHRGTIPLSGGLAIYCGAVPLLFIFLGVNRLTVSFFIASLLVLAIGLLDDRAKGTGKELSPWPKLLVQIAAASILYWSGTKIVGIGQWFGDGGFYSFPAWLSFLATCLWVVGIMNMLNFIDGLDGLAGGISIFVTLTLFFIAFLQGELAIALFAMVMTGAILAFLRYNFHPATIFLGDSGSMLLGLTIAFLSIEGAMKGATLITFAILLLALGIPFFDLLQVIFTRLRQGRPIYQADRSHLHHRLLSLGLNQKQVIMIFYLAGICFSLTSLFLYFFFG
jgi:UDP-GlcNAc:undecaprenyl-phosphate GlcNAc-1-phosphate transferase